MKLEHKLRGIEVVASVAGLVACLGMLMPTLTGMSDSSSLLFGLGAMAHVPVILLAALWFSVVLGSRVVGSRYFENENLSAYLLVPSVLSLSILVDQMRRMPRVPWVWGVIAAAVAAVAVALALAETPPLRQWPRRAAADLRRGGRPLVLVAFVLALVFAFAAHRLRKPVSPQRTWASVEEFRAWYVQQPRTTVTADSSALVFVLKFHDYQCPPCKRVFEEYEPILEQYRQSHPGQVVMVTRDYPLDPECNPNTARALHPAACAAAVAVRLAEMAGRREEMMRWLFANQKGLSRDAVREAARTVGNVSDFDGRYEAVLRDVRKDVELGASLGVRGTPTFFVNGVQVSVLPKQYFAEALAVELERTKMNARK